MEAQQRQLQLIQLEILHVIDTICSENQIHYSLYAGTLLGAARHQGFIPWDDDLDICMPRADYDRFIQIWEQSAPDGYLLQNKENSPNFSQSFTKIRKNHTAFVQFEGEGKLYHTGIFVDIFPIDRIPYGRLNRAFFKWRCMNYQLLTREFAPPKANALVRLGSNLILSCIPKNRRKKIRQNLLKKITQFNNQHELETVAIQTILSINTILPADMLDDYVELSFDGGKFMCFACWDKCLRRTFGNYMQLPPEEDRIWKHHPIILDFEHNYEEIC